MYIFMLSLSLLVLYANGQGYGRQGFGGGGGGYASDAQSYGRQFRHRPPTTYMNGNNNNFDYNSNPNFGEDGSSSFSAPGSSFSNGQDSGRNAFRGSSWGNSGGSFGGSRFSDFDASDSSNNGPSNRQFEAPSNGNNQPQIEVQPGLASNGKLSEASSSTGNANPPTDIDTTGAKTFGKSAVSSDSSAGAGASSIPAPVAASEAPAVDLPQGANTSVTSNSEQSNGSQLPATSTTDPNSSKLIPEPPVLG